MSSGAPASEVEIVALTRELAAMHGTDLLALGADIDWEYWTLENLLHELPEKWKRSLLARQHGEPVGYAVISRKPQSVHLHHLMIGRPHRGGGLGGRLLERLLSDAKVGGMSRVTLKVLDTNRRAIDFYLRYGFVIGECQPNGYLNLALELAR